MIAPIKTNKYEIELKRTKEILFDGTFNELNKTRLRGIKTKLTKDFLRQQEDGKYSSNLRIVCTEYSKKPSSAQELFSKIKEFSTTFDNVLEASDKKHFSGISVSSKKSDKNYFVFELVWHDEQENMRVRVAIDSFGGSIY